MAYRAMVALSYGLKIRAAGRTVVEGRLVQITTDHASSGEAGSTLVLHFEHGRIVPLEGIRELTRAGE